METVKGLRRRQANKRRALGLRTHATARRRVSRSFSRQNDTAKTLISSLRTEIHAMKLEDATLKSSSDKQKSSANEFAKDHDVAHDVVSSFECEIQNTKSDLESSRRIRAELEKQIKQSIGDAQCQADSTAQMEQKRKERERRREDRAENDLQDKEVRSGKDTGNLQTRL